jgi:hypothetical protein
VQYRELLQGLSLLDEEGSRQQVAQRVAVTTTLLLSRLPAYTNALLASADAGPKMEFMSRLQKQERVQQDAPAGEVLDGLYAAFVQVQAEGGQGPGEGQAGSGSRCAQS